MIRENLQKNVDFLKIFSQRKSSTILRIYGHTKTLILGYKLENKLKQEGK